MSLPIITTPEDIKSIVAYLRTKPTGSTSAEIKAVLKEVADPRKITAFLAWGIVDKSGEKIKLSQLGGEISRNTKSLADAIEIILQNCPPYQSVLEWAYHQSLGSITNADVAGYWHDHHSKVLGSDNENTIKDQAVCFMRLAEGAGLGKFSLGRRGLPTRLDINKDALSEYIEDGIVVGGDDDDFDDEPVQEESSADFSMPVEKSEVAVEVPVATRVFITHGKNMELVQQVETMLRVAEVEYEVAVKEETAAIPVPEKVFGAMRRCNSGIIIVSSEQVQVGDSTAPQINPNVLIEIGAAFLLYDKKVVLLWEKGVPVPSNLQGLYRCEFEGSEISWSAGMKLLAAIKDFKK